MAYGLSRAQEIKDEAQEKTLSLPSCYWFQYYIVLLALLMAAKKHQVPLPLVRHRTHSIRFHFFCVIILRFYHGYLRTAI